MKTEDILILDVLHNEKAWDILHRALFKIKPFKKYEEQGKVPQEALEKFLGMVCRKYCVSIQYIIPSVLKNELNWWTLSAKRSDTHEWLGSVYGHTLYECLCKACINLYSQVKVLKIPKRELEKEENNED